MGRSHMKPDPREAKLPTWAQSHIDVLRMRLREAYEAVDEGSEGSTVFMSPYSDTRRPLGTDPQIEFQEEPDGERHYIQVRRDPHTPGLMIHAVDALAVRPHSSNVVTVHLVDSYGDPLVRRNPRAA